MAQFKDILRIFLTNNLFKPQETLAVRLLTLLCTQAAKRHIVLC